MLFLHGVYKNSMNYLLLLILASTILPRGHFIFHFLGSSVWQSNMYPFTRAWSYLHPFWCDNIFCQDVLKLTVCDSNRVIHMPAAHFSISATIRNRADTDTELSTSFLFYQWWFRVAEWNVICSLQKCFLNPTEMFVLILVILLCVFVLQF